MLNSLVDMPEARLIRVEDKVDLLEARMQRIEEKMDDLLALKQKGAGALWLVTIIFGTAITGMGVEFVHWLIGR